MDAPIVIRASSLDDAADCPRRHALRMFREIQQHYPLRKLYPAIGGLVGTSVHMAAVLMLGGRNSQEATMAAQALFETEAQGGMTLDAVTPSRTVALQQINRGSRTYAVKVLPRVQPALIEKQLTAIISPDLTLSGSPDLFTSDRVLRDLKDEIRGRPHLNQLGSYALLLRSHGHVVERVVIDHIKRQTPKALRTQPAHYEEIEYPVSTAEDSAHDVIKRTAASLMEYRQRQADKDPRAYLAFRANPNSVLCTQKYCPAWNTAWCREGAAAHGKLSV